MTSGNLHSECTKVQSTCFGSIIMLDWPEA